MSAPRCRAAWTKLLLTHARALPPRATERIFARVRRSEVDAIAAAWAFSWLPFQLHMRLLEACRVALGPHAFRHFCRQFVGASLQSSQLFAKQTTFMLELIDGSAWSLVRALPVTTGFVFEQAGEISILSADERVARIVYDRLPAEHARSDAWTLSWLGTFDALADRALVRFDRAIEVEETRCEPARGLFEWTAVVVGRGQRAGPARDAPRETADQLGSGR